jgi:ABC-type transporter Mla MlaB component
MTYIRVAADLTRADIPGLCASLADRLRGGAGGTVVCDVAAVVRADAVTVEALARLRLTAGRHGYTLVVDGANPPLRGLIGLLGLTALLLQPRRQAEQREEPLGVEEVVDARDPPV